MTKKIKCVKAVQADDYCVDLDLLINGMEVQAKVDVLVDGDIDLFHVNSDGIINKDDIHNFIYHNWVSICETFKINPVHPNFEGGQ